MRSYDHHCQDLLGLRHTISLINRMFDFASRQLQTAAELYAAVVEFKSDQAFNLPAPDPWISFTIGSVSVCIV